MDRHRRRRGRGVRVVALAGLLSAAWVQVALAGEPGAKPKATPKVDRTAKPDAGSAAKPFVDIADQAGVRHRHHKPVLDKKLDGIMPWMASVGASCAAADYDKDGDIDLYVVNSQMGEPNSLFRNNGDMTFTDVAASAGVANANAEHGASMDAVWGDYDNDGHLDLYVVKWGWNILYRANGDGTFTDVTEAAGVGDKGNGNAAVWFDFNDDSHLDLYIGNYFRNVDLWHLQDSRQMHEDFETARDAGPNVLYRNDGDGTFTEVGKEMGVDDAGWTLDCGAADYDNDGDQDLVNANDFGQDRVFRVNADGTFTNVTDTAIGWDTHKGMNVEFGDYNNDGNLDLYVTNIWTKEYVKEGNQLYRNMGDGTFSDISFEANVYDAGWCWAGRFWDYDNDGYLDIIVANGYISGNPDDEYFAKLATEVTKPGFDPIDAQNWPMMGDSTFSGYEPSRVWHNEGNEVFTEVATDLGLADTGDGRGLAIADFDNDGDLDVYIANQGQDSSFYRNDLGNGNNWLQVELTGTNCNRDAIGTRVTVVCGGLSQIRELDGGNGDHSQCPYRMHFGLAGHDKIDRLEIRWPTGYQQRFENLQPNQLLRFTENTPKAFLEERRKFKEAQLEAFLLEKEREEKEAKADADAGEAEPQLSWDEMQDFKKEYLEHKQAVEQDPRNPRTRYEFAIVLDARGRRAAALSELERAIQIDPDALLYSNAYRTLIRRHGHVYFDRSIRFFEDLVERHPDKVMPRLNKALAYVDKMPYPKLGIVSQGKLSNKSLAELDIILSKLDAGCWTAKYIRGMNHLHWPRKLGHAPMAIRDFTELIELQKKLPPEKQRDYFALGYVGLGDAFVKNREEGLEENMAKAREAWERGLSEYPDNEELKVRLDLMGRSTEELIEFIKGLRGLEDPVDTDLARVWVD
ncbi:MAG TPA: FG-GAP-like repeat-containing protein [Phycisphaerae bacterium]|nr:FG-GAP-like repeat-containing protein [Phycisphaerae bacterium]